MGSSKVLHTQANASRLICISGADAALGGAQAVLAQASLDQGIELLVVRHDQMGVAADLELRAINALSLKHVDLFNQNLGVYNDPVADYGRDVGVENTTGEKLKGKGLSTDDNCVTSVVATLVADDHLHLAAKRSVNRPLPSSPH